MAKPSKYDILQAVRTLTGLLSQADESSLNAAYQVIATDANNSKYGSEFEPLQFICAAFTAETKRRSLNDGCCCTIGKCEECTDGLT